jgi:hypothetical protein
MKEIELLTSEWNEIPWDLRPKAIALARDRAVRLALTWTGHPDERTYVERGLSGAPSSEVARWSAKPLNALRADFRVCHFFDACLRAQASFLRRKAPPKSAPKLIEWVKHTREKRAHCRDILLDLHSGKNIFSQAGPQEREALKKMMEAVKRENERAEMLLIALAFYPSPSPEKREPIRNRDEPALQPFPGGLLGGVVDGPAGR